MRDLYFKILPKGTCSIAGCLVGFPVLDVRPYGLGHSVQYTTHCFEELGVALPRLELARRSDYLSVMSVYLDTDGERCSAPRETPGALSGDLCRLLREKASEVDAAVSLGAVAGGGVCWLPPDAGAFDSAAGEAPLAGEAACCAGTAEARLSGKLEAAGGGAGSAEGQFQCELAELRRSVETAGAREAELRVALRQERELHEATLWLLHDQPSCTPSSLPARLRRNSDYGQIRGLGGRRL